MATNRWPQFLVWAIMLAAILFTIQTGFFGTPVGNRNFSIVFIWIAWWAILILIAVPLFGRAWCSVCPIPLPGEWLTRGAILDPPSDRSRSSSPPARVQRRGRKKWPPVMRNIWIQNASFILLALFSPVILTTPLVTAIVLMSMLLAAFALGLVFERRSFCRYVCPVGGFIGLYSLAAPLELRIKDKSRCLSCQDKPCYNGSAAGYGCPWGVFPAALTRNGSCGLCLECMRSCPQDNFDINLRPLGTDLLTPITRLDEAWKSFIMVGSAMLYAAVLLGPWGSFKVLAYNVFTPAWFGYAFVFFGVILIALPALFAGTLLLTQNLGNFPPVEHLPQLRRKPDLNEQITALITAFTSFSTALIPLGLMFWIAFSLSFVLTNATYIASTLSDPFGWGWDLLRTAELAWRPLAGSLITPLQTIALAIGLIWSSSLARKIAARKSVSPIPVVIFILGLTLGMLWLLL